MYFLSGATGRLAVTQGGWKLLYNVRDQTSELYDLSTDPRERRDLSESETAVAQARTSLLRGWLANAPRPYADGVRKVVELDEQTIEQLKALGYTSRE